MNKILGGLEEIYGKPQCHWMHLRAFLLFKEARHLIREIDAKGFPARSQIDIEIPLALIQHFIIAKIQERAIPIGIGALVAIGNPRNEPQTCSKTDFESALVTIADFERNMDIGIIEFIYFIRNMTIISIFFF